MFLSKTIILFIKTLNKSFAYLKKKNTWTSDKNTKSNGVHWQYVHIHTIMMEEGGEECQKRTNNSSTPSLYVYVSSCYVQSAVRPYPFFLFLFFSHRSNSFGNHHWTTVQNGKKKRKKAHSYMCWEHHSYVLSRLYESSRKKSEEEEEEIRTVPTFYITWKANKNNNNNNRCVKHNISTIAHCARFRALSKMSLFSFNSCVYHHSRCLFLFPRPRNDSTAANAKEQKMENILLFLFSSHHQTFSLEE